MMGYLAIAIIELIILKFNYIMESTKKEDGPIVYFTNKIKDPEKRNEKVCI
jgi:hypothetical protein